MRLKGIGATTHIDIHNTILPKETLEDLAREINCGEYAIGVGIEHNPLIMPIGKVIKGEVVSLDDGHYGIMLEQEIFETFRFFDTKDVIYYKTESELDFRPFIDTKEFIKEKTEIRIDPVNFSHENLEQFQNLLNEIDEIDSGFHMRKSEFPDPYILFSFATGTFAMLIGKKIGEKVLGKMAEDSVTFYSILKRIIFKSIQYCNPKNRPIIYSFQESGEYLMELIIVTRNANVVLDALQQDKLKEVKVKIDNLKNDFQISIAKIQMLYVEENQEWEINYFTTATGQVIGTEKCYKRTVSLSEPFLNDSSRVEASVELDSN